MLHISDSKPSAQDEHASQAARTVSPKTFGHTQRYGYGLHYLNATSASFKVDMRANASFFFLIDM
jgi:hypothetical protein